MIIERKRERERENVNLVEEDFTIGGGFLMKWDGYFFFFLILFEIKKKKIFLGI